MLSFSNIGNKPFRWDCFCVSALYSHVKPRPQAGLRSRDLVTKNKLYWSGNRPLDEVKKQNPVEDLSGICPDATATANHGID